MVKCQTHVLYSVTFSSFYRVTEIILFRHWICTRYVIWLQYAGCWNWERKQGQVWTWQKNWTYKGDNGCSVNFQLHARFHITKRASMYRLTVFYTLQLCTPTIMDLFRVLFVRIAIPWMSWLLCRYSCLFILLTISRKSVCICHLLLEALVLTRMVQ